MQTINLLTKCCWPMRFSSLSDNCLLSLLVFLSMIFCFSSVLASDFSQEEQQKLALKENPFLWGGGGAYTSVVKFNNELYLSSDVTGAWKNTEGGWQPYVNGLSNYNVTALANFGESLFAIATKELLYTDGNGEWVKTDVSLDTYRSITTQAYAISINKKTMCFANRSGKIQCIDSLLNLSEYSTQLNSINGVFFSQSNNHQLYFYSSSALFSFDLNTKKARLIAEFEEKIVSILTVQGKTLVVSQKGIFDLQNLETPLYSLYFKKIVSAFEGPASNSIFIGVGSKWNIKLERLTIDNGKISFDSHIKPNFDDSLPHRTTQKNLTMLLSINRVDNSMYLTDYWGVYRLDDTLANDSDNTFEEVSNNAFNIVSTDLVVANNHYYISTMDNGVIKIDKPFSGESALQKTAISFNSIKGHAWSMSYFDNTLHALFSPWDKPNDYLFVYSELDNNNNVMQLTSQKSRAGKGAFWGKSYSRALAYYYGLVSFRDGYNGGLVAEPESRMSIEAPFTFGKYNKVYRAMEELNGLLYIATCEQHPNIVALNQNAEEQFTITLPKDFCPFTAYKHKETLYFLGAQNGKSIIYELKGKSVHVLIKSEVGSAFYAMAIDPKNDSNIVAATISWSKRSSSGLFVSTNGGADFTSKACVLSHLNGVASIKFDEGRSAALLLQKVGGLISIPKNALFTSHAC